MRSAKLLIVAVTTLCIAGTACQRENSTPDDAITPVAPQEEPEQNSIFERGSANIYFDEETTQMVEMSLTHGQLETKSASLNSVLDQLGTISMERIFPDAGEFEERSRRMGMHRWYRIKYNPSIKEDKAAELLRSFPGVCGFSPVLKAQSEASLPFDDPKLESQWQYYNNGRGKEWTIGADMNVVPVWRFFTTGDPKVTVAVIDGGVQLDHEDLAANTDAANSYNFCDDNAYITPNDHGTHVAGTIAAVNNNGLGVSGMAGGDAAAGQGGVRIISCQIFSDSKNGNSERAIKWAADHGAVICNNSWNYNFGSGDEYDEESAKYYTEFFKQPNEGEYMDPMKSAIDYFNECAGFDSKGNQVGPMAGGLVVFSAGNNAKPYSAPASYPGVLAIGAIGPNGGRAYYSNYGDWVDLATTGGDYHYGQILSTVKDNQYNSMQGTSMAAPHATGEAALLVSYFGGPGFTREMLIERMLNGNNPAFDLSASQIGPMADVFSAFTYDAEPLTPAPVTDLSAQPKSNTITVSWSVTGKDQIPASGYLLFYGNSAEDVAAATPDKKPSGVRVLTVNTTVYSVGEALSHTFNNLGFETGYSYKVIGFDCRRRYSEASPVISATTEKNNPPVITPDKDVTNLSIHNYETISINFSFSDPDEHDYTVDIENGSDAETWLKTDSNVYNVKINGGKANEGTYTAIITATDSFKATGTFKLTYKIMPNQPPVAIASIPDQLIEGKSQTVTVNLGDYFTDPDGEELRYEATSSSNVIHATASEGTLHLTALGFGMSEISVSAKDARGDSATLTFKVLVRESGVTYQAYPNPVVDYLYVGTGNTAENVQIQVSSATGSIIYDNTMQVSAFSPAQIDMSDCAPGRYGLTLRFGGKEYRQTIVKK